MFFGSKLRRAVTEVKKFGRSIVAIAVQKRSEKLSEGDEDNSTYNKSISGSLINFLMDGIGDHEIVADAALNYLSAGMTTSPQSQQGRCGLDLYWRISRKRHNCAVLDVDLLSSDAPPSYCSECPDRTSRSISKPENPRFVKRQPPAAFLFTIHDGYLLRELTLISTRAFRDQTV